MGTRLGRYDITDRPLAKGSLTDLLLGRASGMEGFQRHVAIKRLREEHALDPACLDMFLNEARLAASLHHHNIVQVLDIGEGEGQPFFAMEYVHGVDLRRLLGHLAKRGEQLPLQHVVSVIAAAAAALHHAHEQKGADGQPLGIVHRQVTPANILVGYDGNVKLVDFGIAKAAIKRLSTGVGVLRGSAPYMAPEQCAGRSVDRRSDVFALGIVLYELSTVRRLFKGANEFLTMSAVINAEVPRPSQYRRDVPGELEVVMLKALSRDPLSRYQTAGEMADALDSVARLVGVGASTTQLANYMKLQFGEQKEPWLVGSVELDPETTAVDFDGAASGLAPPPNEAVKNNAIPRVMAATKSSPIQKARTVAVTPSKPPIDKSFSVATTVDDEPPPIGHDDDDDAQPTEPIAPAAPRPRDETAIVEPLHVMIARAQTAQAEPRSRVVLYAAGAVGLLGAIIAVIALWPGADLAPAPAKAESPPIALPIDAAVDAPTDAPVDAAVDASVDAAIDAAIDAVIDAPVDVAPEPPVESAEPVLEEPPPVAVAKPPAPKPKPKPAIKKKKKPPATKKTKPTWNPDDLFLGE